jgi:hypothetical protein
VIRCTLSALLVCAANLAFAQNPPADLVDFMGGHGCTFGEDSRAAAQTAGFTQAQIDGLIDQSLADQTAKREGDYVVLGEAICDIRVPNIDSTFTVSSPEILAMTSDIDAFATDGFPGCFLLNPSEAFDVLRDQGRGSGFFEYVNFVGAGIVDGKISFYGNSRLAVPPGFQIVDGDCADVPQIEAIRRRRGTLQVVFGPLIRAMGKENICGPDAWPAATPEQMDWLIEFQGGNPSNMEMPGNEANAWMWMEIYMLTVAAGWHEGMTGTDKGTPRPPLCHYP